MDYNSEFFINKRKISFDCPTYFIADIASNHDGDIERAKHLIWLAAESGANAAKFQHFSAKTIVSDYGFKSLGGKYSHQSSWEKSIYETYEDASLNLKWTEILLDTCNEANIDFFTSSYSIPIVDEVGPFVSAHKIGSGDINYLDIIAHISKMGKPVLLATGATNYEEVKRAVNLILKYNSNIVLMQCNTNYTASVENYKNINLNVLKTYQKEYPNMILGLSDHTKSDTTVLGAIALGARVIEKHFTDDTTRKGPDHSFAIDPQSWKAMIEKSRELEMALGTGLKKVEENEGESVILQRRCLRLIRDLPVKHVLTNDDLIALRPAPKGSYEPYQINALIGKKLKSDKIKGDALFSADID